MKFICQKESLLKEISIANDIISSKNTFSILSTLYLELNSNTLTIKATDTKIYWTTSLPVEGEEDGISKINYDKFSAIVRNFPNSEIIVEQIDNEVMLRNEENSVNFTLKSIAKEDYPTEKEIDDSKYFNISQAELISMINQTSFAIAENDNQMSIFGALLQKEEDKLVMVGTNGKRMSCIFKEINNPIQDFEDIIIPSKVLSIIKKIINEEGSIQLAIEDNCLFVKINNCKFYSNLIEGKFPPYKRVIPTDNNNSLIVKRSDLLNAISRVALFVEKNISKFYMNIQINSILISSEKSEYGEAKETIDCEYNGEPMIITLNTNFMLDPLKAIDTEFIKIEFDNPKKALVLLSEPKSDFMHIVMPMLNN